jgi:hypothetical protein
MPAALPLLPDRRYQGQFPGGYPGPGQYPGSSGTVVLSPLAGVAYFGLFPGFIPGILAVPGAAYAGGLPLLALIPVQQQAGVNPGPVVYPGPALYPGRGTVVSLTARSVVAGILTPIQIAAGDFPGPAVYPGLGTYPGRGQGCVLTPDVLAVFYLPYPDSPDSYPDRVYPAAA